MLEPQQIIDSLESISRNVMLTEEQRLAASAAAHQLAESRKPCACRERDARIDEAIDALEEKGESNAEGN
jgi:pantothenate synthetase